MNLPHALLKAISRVLIGIVLFAQLAVASHACPGMMGTMSMAAFSASDFLTPRFAIRA